jgi:hypothetical protein
MSRDAEPFLQCVRCGECCKNGPSCGIRPWLRAPVGFSGRCEFLCDDGDCEVMKRAGMECVRAYTNVTGACDFPHLRVAVDSSGQPVDGDYQ